MRTDPKKSQFRGEIPAENKTERSQAKLSSPRELGPIVREQNLSTHNSRGYELKRSSYESIPNPDLRHGRSGFGYNDQYRKKSRFAPGQLNKTPVLMEHYNE